LSERSRRGRGVFDRIDELLYQMGAPHRDKKALSPETIDELRELYARKWINNAELKRIERETGKPFKRGRFGRAETEACMRAVDTYIEQRSLDRARFIELMFVRNNEKSVGPSKAATSSTRDFFLNIAGQLDGRPVVNVYHFLRRRLHPSNKGESWGRELDGELKRLHLIYGPQWERIGRELGRFHVACRDRFRKIQAAYTRGPWTDAECDLLSKAYEQASSGGRPEGVATWTFISTEVGSRSANQCQWKWTENISFRNPAGPHYRLDWLPPHDRALVTAIYDAGVEHESELSWSALYASKEQFQAFTAGRLRNRWVLLKKRVRGAEQLPIDDVCEWLMRDLVPLSPELVNSESEVSDRET